MEKLTSESVDVIRGDIKASMEAIELSHGITIKLGSNISWDETMFSQSLKVLAGDGSALERKLWDQHARYLSIPKEWFGIEFINHDKKRCRIDGINPKAHKMPIKFTELDTGRKMKTSIEAIKRSMQLPANSDPA